MSNPYIRAISYAQSRRHNNVTALGIRTDRLLVYGKKRSIEIIYDGKHEDKDIFTVTEHPSGYRASCTTADVCVHIRDLT